eukprot:gene27779-49471_t
MFDPLMTRILFFNLLLLGSCGYAILRGGAPERITGWLLIGATVLTPLAAGGLAMRFVQAEVGIFVVDVALLVALTIVFLVVTVTLLPFSIFSVQASGAGTVVSLTALVALLVCLIPTTIGGLLSAVGVAGMSRMMQANVIATSGRAVEAAGDVDVLLLDKTGTITHGNRQAALFIPAPGVSLNQLALCAAQASMADETPEGRSIVTLAQSKVLIEPLVGKTQEVPFTAQTRMSGMDLTRPDGSTRQLRKG